MIVYAIVNGEQIFGIYSEKKRAKKALKSSSNLLMINCKVKKFKMN